MTQSFTTAQFIGCQVEDDGELWEIINVGHTFDDGTTHCHLISLEKGRQHANGWHPNQVAVNIDLSDAELPVKKISIYQCSPGWEVVPCHGSDENPHIYGGDSEWFSSKSEAISAAREWFRETPSALTLDMGMTMDFGREMKIIRTREI